MSRTGRSGMGFARDRFNRGRISQFSSAKKTRQYAGDLHNAHGIRSKFADALLAQPVATPKITRKSLSQERQMEGVN
jgi:hypothetical protein